MIMAAAFLPKDRRTGWQPQGPQLKVQFFQHRPLATLIDPPHLNIFGIFFFLMKFESHRGDLDVGRTTLVDERRRRPMGSRRLPLGGADQPSRRWTGCHPNMQIEACERGGTRWLVSDVSKHFSFFKWIWREMDQVPPGGLDGSRKIPGQMMKFVDKSMKWSF